ncbi:hypothetical protein DM48_341 [Burkholderia gladioli]|uniref:Uncharacterized protein n=1 Tax=Burkholderia gladioli TaxID=28095 RepID=A0AAW3F3W1_BURGA|nr:hypothetical protein [Burkholderia gladioli]KGC15418.1 hypothetical protein DM48_341 [Burkholderia gladioli]
MIFTSELIVRVGILQRQIVEASAKGFSKNGAALKLVNELKDLVDDLEAKATEEYLK